MYRERHARSALKAISWRVLGTVVTTAVVYLVTRRLALSFAVGTVEFLSKIGLFWLHERVWDRLRWGRERVPPAVIWFTGYPGSGKSTVADWVGAELRRQGFPVERLDGDTIRDLFPATGFSREERHAHIQRVGYLASKLEAHGVMVVASFISPYAGARAFVRGLCRSFIEVYMDTPLEECERRDPKGLYAKARRGAISRFTGVDDPYEPPAAPEVTIDSTRVSVEAAGAQVLQMLARHRARAS